MWPGIIVLGSPLTSDCTNKLQCSVLKLKHKVKVGANGTHKPVIVSNVTSPKAKPFLTDVSLSVLQTPRTFYVTLDERPCHALVSVSSEQWVVRRPSCEGTYHLPPHRPRSITSSVPLPLYLARWHSRAATLQHLGQLRWHKPRRCTDQWMSN